MYELPSASVILEPLPGGEEEGVSADGAPSSGGAVDARRG